VTRKIHVCRQPELQEVKGLRLAVSMLIEIADVCLPIAKSALNNFSRVASWLLVTLIGALQIIISLNNLFNQTKQDGRSDWCIEE